VGDHEYLRVSPMKGVRRFSIKGKLAPRYIGPYPIIDKYGPMSYQVELSSKLSGVHNVFHVFQHNVFHRSFKTQLWLVGPLWLNRRPSEALRWKGETVGWEGRGMVCRKPAPSKL
jgi:hypothetical protein